MMWNYANTPQYRRGPWARPSLLARLRRMFGGAR